MSHDDDDPLDVSEFLDVEVEEGYLEGDLDEHVVEVEEGYLQMDLDEHE